MAEADPEVPFVDLLLALPLDKRVAKLRQFGWTEADAFDRAWGEWAHDGQSPPAACPDGGDWNSWVIMAGRGFGKTLAGSNWITSAIAQGGKLRIALVGATLDEARRIMVEGRSGLLEVAGAWITEWHPSLRRLRFRTGAEATLFSGASPEQLRGPEHHLAWCDELAKWEKPAECWDMLQLGLRLGDSPRVLVTTTPRPGPVLRRIMAAPGCVVTGGRTRSNPHLPKAYVDNVETLYAGTRLGRQELDGELLTDTPGALWTVELLERSRLQSPLPGNREAPPNTPLPGNREGPGVGLSAEERDPSENPPTPQSPPCFQGGEAFTRTVIAIDPPSGAGTCGIIACARDREGRAHVLADHSVTARSPEGWARAVADAARIHSLDPPRDGEGDRPSGGGGGSPRAPIFIVAESNQGGRMVESVLRTADPSLRVKLVTATVGKSERAAPVAMLFEAGKVLLHGRFPELESELLGMIAGGEYHPPWSGGPGGPGVSPDRADAMVWGLTELLLQKERAPPRISLL